MTSGRNDRVENCADYGFVCLHSTSNASVSSAFAFLHHVTYSVSLAEDFGHVFQPHAQCFLGRTRWHEIGDICSQTFLLAQESSIDFHCV